MGNWRRNRRSILLVLVSFVSAVVVGQVRDPLSNDSIYADVDVPAVWKSECPRDTAYRDCADLAMYRWIHRHLKYPTGAMLAGATADLTVTFIVEPDGTTGQVHMTDDPGYGFTSEVEKMVREMNRFMAPFHPAEAGGRPVRSRRQVRLRFGR